MADEAVKGPHRLLIASRVSVGALVWWTSQHQFGKWGKL